MPSNQAFAEWARKTDDRGWRFFGLDEATRRFQLAVQGRVVRPVLAVVALVSLIYLGSVLLRGPRSLAYPIDLVMLVLGSALTCVGLRCSMVSSATMTLLVALDNIASFEVGAYGLRGPAPAIFAVSIVMCGIVVSGRFLKAWYAVSMASLLVACRALGSDQWPLITGWILALGGVCWITNLFAREMDRLVDEVAQGAKREQERIVEERTRIAREIHDTLAQGFTGIMMQLNAAEHVLPAGGEKAHQHLEKARLLAAESLGQARESVWALRPEASDGDLVSTLERVGARLVADSAVKFCVESNGQSAVLPSQTLWEIQRIVSEAMTNSLRHAQASSILVKIGFGNELIVSIEDDGIGIGSESVEGFGLKGIRERADKIGTTLEISPRTGGGTVVTLRMGS